MKKKLLYATLSFPGDLYTEKAFLDPELTELRRHFSEIVLLPADPAGRNRGYDRSLPDGVSVDWSLVNDKVFHSKPLKLIYLFHPFVIRTLVSMRTEARSPRQWIKGMFQAINMVRIARIARKTALRNNMTPDDTLLMSMWFHDSAAALAYLAAAGGWHMATHAHTSDIYDERMLFRSRNLRSRLLDSIDCVLTISRRGRDYLAERFPRHAGRFVLAPLGSTRLFTPSDRRDHSLSLSFMTVARLDPIKRIDLIMEVLHALALQLDDRKITYTVIGDGECMDFLVTKSRELALPNLEIRFEGALENEEIQRRYASVPPDWFILMSRSEGIPVSMGEAMSYAIPVITTDVGEISELVSDDCAVLLPRDAEVDTYTKKILPAVADSSIRDRMSLKALERWEKSFDSSRLSKDTAGILNSLMTGQKS